MTGAETLVSKSNCRTHGGPLGVLPLVHSMDKPLQSAPCSRIQGRDMSGEADSSEVVRRWKPRQLLGVEVLHYSGASEDRRSLSEDYALVLNLTGQYERRHRSTREQGGPGSLALCEPGEAYSIRRVQGPGSGHILLIEPAEMVRVVEGPGHQEEQPPARGLTRGQAATGASSADGTHRSNHTSAHRPHWCCWVPRW